MSKKALAHSVYDELRRRLVTCEYAPGSMLNEARLSEEFGVSRTPIREAVRRLSEERFLTVLPKAGVLVTPVGLAELAQIFQTRQLIEPMSLGLGGHTLPRETLEMFRAEFARDEPDPLKSFEVDMAMHQFLVEHCGNRHIIDMMRTVFDHNRRAVIFTRQHECRVHDARKEHFQVVETILDGDIPQAQVELRNHIDLCRIAAIDWYMTRIEHAPADIAMKESLVSVVTDR